MLNIVPGSGRAFRSRRYIAFLAEHDLELWTLFSLSPPDLWEQVETLSQNTSACRTALVVLDLDKCRYFRTGSIELKLDGDSIDPSIESGSFGPLAVIECGDCATAATVVDTFLGDGYIAADGFLLRPARPAAGSSPAAGLRQASNVASPSIFDDPDIALADIGRGRPRVAQPSQPPDEVSDTTLEAESGDETAEKDTIDKVETSTDVEPVSTSTTGTVETPGETGWSFREPGQPLTSSGHAVAQPAATEPTTTEPATSAASVGGGSQSRPSANQTTTRSAMLDVAGAGVNHVAVGALIGRYPDKHPVPENYVAIRVTGSDISRVHLELWVDTAGFLRARDPGSANGATVTREAGTIHDVPTTERGLELTVGDRIDFGSGSARFTGWGRGG